MAVIHALFDSLLTWDYDTNEPTPLAATALPTVSEDGLVYTFTLREGAKFHNGDPVDAESFKRGWERVASPTMAAPSDICYHLAPIAGYTYIYLPRRQCRRDLRHRRARRSHPPGDPRSAHGRLHRRGVPPGSRSDSAGRSR